MVTQVLHKIRRQFKFVFDLLPSDLLIKNNVKITKEEFEAAMAETAIERSWYESRPSFQNDDSIERAVKSGKLQKIIAGSNYLPILRFRNPKLHEQYPPYLTRETAALLNEICAEWRKRCTKAGLSGDIRLAITSLTRTAEYQERLIKTGKIAQPDSPHTRGEAFDIDGSGYYEKATPINARRDEHSAYHRAFSKLDAAVTNPEYGDYSKYNPRVHKILHEVLEDMKAMDKLHYLHEYPGTQYACFHVCRNPLYVPKTRH